MLDTQVLQAILTENFGATVDGDTYHLKEDLRAAVMVQHAGGVMMIAKVQQITFKSTYLIVASSDELTYVSPSDVFGVRHAEIEEETADKRPGFRT